MVQIFRTTLARWRASKEAETGEKERRPYLASECTDVSKCEKWRLEIIREISKKVAQIQNGESTNAFVFSSFIFQINRNQFQCHLFML